MFRTTVPQFSTIRSNNRRIRKLRIARYRNQQKVIKKYIRSLRNSGDAHGYTTWKHLNWEQKNHDKVLAQNSRAYKMEPIQKEPWERNVRMPVKEQKKRLSQLLQEQEQLEASQQDAHDTDSPLYGESTDTDALFPPQEFEQHQQDTSQSQTL